MMLRERTSRSSPTSFLFSSSSPISRSDNQPAQWKRRRRDASSSSSSDEKQPVSGRVLIVVHLIWRLSPRVMSIVTPVGHCSTQNTTRHREPLAISARRVRDLEQWEMERRMHCALNPPPSTPLLNHLVLVIN